MPLNWCTGMNFEPEAMESLAKSKLSDKYSSTKNELSEIKNSCSNLSPVTWLSPSSLRRKYGISSRRSPKASCIRSHQKTSTPRSRIVVPKQRRSSGRSPAANVHGSNGKIRGRKLSIRKRNSVEKNTRLSLHLRIWDRQLKNIKLKAKKLRDRDEEIRKRYDRIQKKARAVLEGSFTTENFGDYKSTVDSKYFVHRKQTFNSMDISDGNESEVSSSLKQKNVSMMTDEMQFLKKNFQIFSSVCNIYHVETDSGIIASPLKTILKDGKQCTFCWQEKNYICCCDKVYMFCYIYIIC